MLDRKHLFHLLVGGILLLVLFAIVASFQRNVLLRSAALTPGPPSESTPPASRPETLAEIIPPSVPYTAGTASGQLLPAYAADGTTLTGWTYQGSDTEKTCSAGPDGVWKSCTFSPKQEPWPSNVPPALLDNPPLKSTFRPLQEVDGAQSERGVFPQ